MTAAHTNVLDLLGKQVSFIYKENGFSFPCSGFITELIFSSSGDIQLSLDQGDFYPYFDLFDFSITAYT